MASQRGFINKEGTRSKSMIRTEIKNNTKTNASQIKKGSKGLQNSNSHEKKSNHLQNSNSSYKNKDLQNSNSPQIREQRLAKPYFFWNKEEQRLPKLELSRKKTTKICKDRIRPNTHVWIRQCFEICVSLELRESCHEILILCRW